MTSKLVVNTIEADTGISSVSFASSISMDSTSKFHFSAAGVDIGADTNINRPAAGVLGFNINGAEKVRIDTNGHIHGVGVVTATHFYGNGSNLTSLPAQATIANNADNRVITGGSGVNLNGEANLTFNGNALHISGTTGTSAGGLLRLDATTGDNFILYDNTHDNSEWAVGNDSSTRGNFDFWYNSGGGYPSNPIVRFNTTGVTVQGNTVADNNTLTAISKTTLSKVGGFCKEMKDVKCPESKRYSNCIECT